MSNGNIPAIPPGVLTPEQIQAVSGGECTPSEYIKILTQLKDGYETLVDFTSYVIERVAK